MLDKNNNNEDRGQSRVRQGWQSTSQYAYVKHIFIVLLNFTRMFFFFIKLSIVH